MQLCQKKFTMYWGEFDMIQNQIITKKLEEKTKDDTKMKAFINELIEKELAGGQFTKIYKQLIEENAKE